MKRIDLTGQVFGRLKVIQYVGFNKNYRALWKCMCECGKLVIASQHSLRNGYRKSCGCLNKETSSKIGKKTGKAAALSRRLPPGEAGFNRVYGSYRKAAKDRNLSFNLNRDQFKTLSQDNCFYCDLPPATISISTNKRSDLGQKERTKFIYNGIDRRDNDIGYEPENCVTCCTICNFMKRSTSEVEFLRRIYRIYYKRIVNRTDW